MEDLTFGEQVKIILGRKGMTIKELAETIEKQTGQKMSRQNLTQRLGRDNFQEQDMRKIAEILGCPFHLSIISSDVQTAEKPVKSKEATVSVKQPDIADTASSAREPEVRKAEERDMTIGELYKIHEDLSQLEENIQEGKPIEAIKEELQKAEASAISTGKQQEPEEEKKGLFRTGTIFLRKKGNSLAGEKASEDELKPEVQAVPAEPSDSEAGPESEVQPVIRHDDAEEDRNLGDINPYTGREYQSNSVRMHPTRIGYVQVYDRVTHKWTDMTEWAFLGYQERKKVLLGKEYEPPIYLD